MAEVTLTPRSGEVSGASAPVVIGGAERSRRFATTLIIVGGTILTVMVLAALLAPVIAPWGEREVDPTAALAPPSADHWLGTDVNGMDIFSRLLYAARLDLGIAIGAIALAVVIGSAVGLVAGYYGGWVDDVLMRVVDIFQSFPAFIMALVVASLMGGGVLDLVVVIAVVNAPAYARLVRAEARSVREQPYVAAAVTSGVSHLSVMWRHVLPNCLTPVRVIAPLNCGWAMLTLAGLSYLGLGVPVPTAEWGAMINLGSGDVVAGHWWTSVPPGLFLLASVLGFSLLGEGLQERAEARRR
ncbi:MAG TPA: ABC transporter permease [Natronosporangium sp.]|nr:ABC transporter permease [Natronosporangium sp.]